jgi:V/A-type H+-transporting ATPase subunit E
MAVEKIRLKIMADAQAEVRAIEDEFAERLREIQADRDEQIEAIEKQAQEEARRRAEDRQKKDIATAELDMRKALLDEKQKLIQKVFDQALRRLVQMKGEEHQRFIVDLLLKTVEVGDEEVIVSSAEEHKLVAELLPKVNDKLLKDKKKGELRLVQEDRELLGGFILRRGKREVNCSLSALFNTIREEVEPEVAKALFSK